MYDAPVGSEVGPGVDVRIVFPDNGVIRTSARINYEDMCFGVIEGKCCKLASILLVQTQKVVVLKFVIVDVNDHSPQWNSNVQIFYISEDTSVNMTFDIIPADDVEARQARLGRRRHVRRCGDARCLR